MTLVFVGVMPVVVQELIGGKGKNGPMGVERWNGGPMGVERWKKEMERLVGAAVLLMVYYVFIVAFAYGL